jgi:glycerol uptake facilitator-like aquaporin
MRQGKRALSHITAAYWLTASTSFASPAVTVARSITDSFSGIRPWTCRGFILAQITGAVTATLLIASIEILI